MAKYVYALVPVDPGNGPGFIDKLNQLAAEGWRLVPIVLPGTAALIVERENEPPGSVVRNL
jgi:hypothetical protein